MQTILKDLKTAAGLFVNMRKARKHGGAIRVEEKVQIPDIQPRGFYSTVEGCALSHCEKEIVNAAHGAFSRLSDSEKHRLTFSPKAGEFAERAAFWKNLLKPNMPERQYRKAILTLIRQYIRIKRDLTVIRPLKSIKYPLYPDMPENAVMSRNDNMHRALMEKLHNDLYVVWDYDRKAGNKAAHDFMHSKERGRLVNLSLWFNMSDECFNGLVTYGEYKRARKAVDFCLRRLTMENQKGGGTA